MYHDNENSDSEHFSCVELWTTWCMNSHSSVLFWCSLKSDMFLQPNKPHRDEMTDVCSRLRHVTTSQLEDEWCTHVVQFDATRGIPRRPPRCLGEFGTEKKKKTAMSLTLMVTRVSALRL